VSFIYDENYILEPIYDLRYMRLSGKLSLNKVNHQLITLPKHLCVPFVSSGFPRQRQDVPRQRQDVPRQRQDVPRQRQDVPRQSPVRNEPSVAVYEMTSNPRGMVHHFI
jgi:hypothetical protein